MLELPDSACYSDGLRPINLCSGACISSDDSQITQLLRNWTAGDAEALGKLLHVLYEPLRQLAHQRMRREQGADSLNTTALVHEAYLKLADSPAATVVDRHHFLAVATGVMRNVLVDHARARSAVKRGGGGHVTELNEESWVSEVNMDDVCDLDDALNKLETLAPRQRIILEQHYFGGLSIEETAGVLDISERTVKRELRAARAWLAMYLGSHGL